jgi:hypothetical protein
MTYFYATRSWNSQPQITEETIEAWRHLSDKKNWRIVQLPNGFFQTEYKNKCAECKTDNCNCNSKKDSCCEQWNDVTRRETIEGAEAAIDGSVDHYSKKLEFIKGPKVVKTFK